MACGHVKESHLSKNCKILRCSWSKACLQCAAWAAFWLVLAALRSSVYSKLHGVGRFRNAGLDRTILQTSDKQNQQNTGPPREQWSKVLVKGLNRGYTGSLLRDYKALHTEC